MADEAEKDELIRALSCEVVDLNMRILKERQACYEEYGRVRVLLNKLYDCQIDAGAKAQIAKVLAEMDSDCKDDIGAASDGSKGWSLTYTSKSTIH